MSNFDFDIYVCYIDVFCGGTLDGSIKVWDARVNHNRNVLGVEHHIPNTHGKYRILYIYI